MDRSKNGHDPAKLRGQAERARRAAEIVNDPIYLEALDAIRKEVIKGFLSSAAEDQKARDNAYLLNRFVNRWEAHFEAILRKGDNAKLLLAVEEDVIGPGAGQV